MNKRDRDAEFLFEVAFLKKIYRTGYPYLGSGKENVASHSFGVAFISWMLALIYEKNEKKQVDKEKMFKMALLHDLPETRTGDFNAVNKIYNKTDEKRALKDALLNTILEKEAYKIYEEYRELNTIEAQLVHDADTIDLLIQLKEQLDLNNPYADKWIKFAKKRLITPWGKELAERVLKTNWCAWWFIDLVGEEPN